MSESTAMAVSTAGQLGVLTEPDLKLLLNQANIFYKSGLCAKKFENPEAVLITAMYGREIGMSFMQSLADIHVVDGVPGLSAHAQGALIRRNMPKAKIEIIEQNEMVCRISMWREGMDKAQEFSYTIEEADRANLTGKDNWRNHPTDMLTARATSRGYRFMFKDVMGGFGYTPEELYESRSREPAPALPAAAPTGGIPKVDPAEAEAAAGIPEDDKPAADPQALQSLDTDLHDGRTPAEADVLTTTGEP